MSMTPDDMEEHLEAVARSLGDTDYPAVTFPESVARKTATALRSLLLDYQERGRALANLIRMNEEHNAAVEKVMGRPLNWSDNYLNEARAALTKEDA